MREGRWLGVGVVGHPLGRAVGRLGVAGLWHGRPLTQPCHRTPVGPFGGPERPTRPQSIEHKSLCNHTVLARGAGRGGGRDTYPCLGVNIFHSWYWNRIHWLSIVCKSRHFYIVNRNCTNEPYDLLSLKPAVPLSSESI